MKDADHITAEYLVRQVPEELLFDTEQMWQLHWADLNPYMRSVYLELKMAWLTSGFSKAEAERAAREAVGFENPPRFLSSPQIPDWEAHEEAADAAREYVSPTRFIAGWMVVLALVAVIFWGV